jgi:hypothetical protein
VTPAKSYAAPRRWSDEELEVQRRAAIADFIAERGAEGSARYRAAFASALELARRLFAATDDLLDFRSGAALAAEPGLLRVARYLGAPPISADDLDTLAESRIASRKRLDPDLAEKAARVIASVLDPERFAWLVTNGARRPTEAERLIALRWTAGLLAASETAVGRRGESSRRQEKAVRDLLSSEQLGFKEVPTRAIEVTGGLDPGEFTREASVVGIKCDVPVGLRDGRFLLIEAKVSNSALNSVKRLNREVGGKAREWTRALGERAVPAAVLAGVFKLGNLRDAQAGGVTIFWERELAPLAAFIEAAR